MQQRIKHSVGKVHVDEMHILGKIFGANRSCTIKNRYIKGNVKCTIIINKIKEYYLF